MRVGIDGGELGSASGIPVTNQLRRYDVMVDLFYKKKMRRRQGVIYPINSMFVIKGQLSKLAELVVLSR